MTMKPRSEHFEARGSPVTVGCGDVVGLQRTPVSRRIHDLSPRVVWIDTGRRTLCRHESEPVLVSYPNHQCKLCGAVFFVWFP